MARSGIGRHAAAGGPAAGARRAAGAPPWPESRRRMACPTSSATSRPMTSSARKASQRSRRRPTGFLPRSASNSATIPTALELWRQAGRQGRRRAGAFRAGHAARDPASRRPADFTQHARNPARSVEIGGNSVVFSPAYGSPFVMDLDRGRRYGTIEDFRNFIKLAHAEPLAAPFRRHDLRAGRRAGQQAPSRHGL